MGELRKRGSLLQHQQQRLVIATRSFTNFPSNVNRRINSQESLSTHHGPPQALRSGMSTLGARTFVVLTAPGFGRHGQHRARTRIL